VVSGECSISVLVRTRAYAASTLTDLGSCAAAPQPVNVMPGRRKPSSGVHIALRDAMLDFMLFCPS
jgi:hypothetical protein